MKLVARRLLGAFQPVVGTSALVERCENDNRLLCDLARQRPRKATQGHLPDSHAPLLVDHDRRTGAWRTTRTIHRRLDDLEEAHSETAALSLVPVLGVGNLVCCERVELDVTLTEVGDCRQTCKGSV